MKKYILIKRSTAGLHTEYTKLRVLDLVVEGSTKGKAEHVSGVSGVNHTICCEERSKETKQGRKKELEKILIDYLFWGEIKAK